MVSIPMHIRMSADSRTADLLAHVREVTGNL